MGSLIAGFIVGALVGVFAARRFSSLLKGSKSGQAGGGSGGAQPK